MKKIIILPSLIMALMLSAPVMASEKSFEIAQMSIADYERTYGDSTKNRVQYLEENIAIIRQDRQLSRKQQAFRIYELRREVITAIEQDISRGLFGVYMNINDKDIIIQKWTAEKKALTETAFQEIEPYLTPQDRRVIQYMREIEKKRQSAQP